LDLCCHASALESARPQDLIDKARKTCGLAVDHAEHRFPLLRVQLLTLERHRRPVDGGQWRSQLVRGDGDELVLEAVELAETVECVVLPTLVEGNRHQWADERN